MTGTTTKDNSELAALLPWYVNGTLDEETMARIDAALESDPALARGLELALEDQAAALELAEEAVVPVSMPARFEAALDREIEQGARIAEARKAAPGLLERVGEWLQGGLFGTGQARLGFAAAVAAVVIVLQSGALVSLLTTGNNDAAGDNYDVAAGDEAPHASGHALLVQIAPTTTMADLTAFLEAERGRIEDGPLPGAMFKLRFEERGESELETLEAAMAGRGDLFIVILPSQ